MKSVVLAFASVAKLCDRLRDDYGTDTDLMRRVDDTWQRMEKAADDLCQEAQESGDPKLVAKADEAMTLMVRATKGTEPKAGK